MKTIKDDTLPTPFGLNNTIIFYAPDGLGPFDWLKQNKILKSSAVILLLLVSSRITFSQQTDTILWSKSIKLKWADFKGNMPKGMEMYTAGCCNFIITRCQKGKIPNYLVINFFKRSCSWVSDTLWTDGILHEQLHFDIGELYARKIRHSIESLRKNKVTNDEKYLITIKKFFSEKSKLDSLYDEQSDHGDNKKGQDLWIKKIQTEMGKLEKYSSDVYYKK